MTSIGDHAFYRCSGLTEVYCYAITPPTISSYSFVGVNDATLYVPAAAVETYKASSWNQQFSKILSIDDAGEAIILTIDGVKYQLTDDGKATAIGYESLGEALVIKDYIDYEGSTYAVTSIADHAFEGTDIASLMTTAPLESIGAYAFANCSKLREIVIASTVTWIGEHAFENDFLLVTIRCMGTTLPGCGANAFSGVNYGNCSLEIYGWGGGSGSGSGSLGDVWGSFTKVDGAGTSQTISSIYGYATVYSADLDLLIPEGITAYTGVINGEWLTLTKVTGDKIPAGTAVVLYGKGGTYRFYFTEGAQPQGENDLKGTDEPLVADGTQYILTAKGGVTAFYQATPGSTIPAGKAYLEADGAGVKGFFFADDATAIEETLSNSPLKGENFYKQGSTIVNLAGQRIQKMQKGINIVNGKKILK